MAGFPKIEAFFDEDGDPWAVFVHGHFDLSLIGSPEWRERFRAKMLADCCRDDSEIAEALDGGAVEQFWIVDTTPEDAEGEVECPWQFCGAGTAGAIPVTGVKFQ